MVFNFPSNVFLSPFPLFAYFSHLVSFPSILEWVSHKTLRWIFMWKRFVSKHSHVNPVRMQKWDGRRLRKCVISSKLWWWATLVKAVWSPWRHCGSWLRIILSRVRHLEYLYPDTYQSWVQGYSKDLTFLALRALLCKGSSVILSVVLWQIKAGASCWELVKAYLKLARITMRTGSERMWVKH